MPEAWLPVGTWLLGGEEVDDICCLVADGEGDHTSVSVEVTPRVFDNVDAIDCDLSRVGGEVLGAESVAICVLEGNGEDISGDGASDLNIVVGSLGHSVVVGGLLEVDAGDGSSVRCARDGDVSSGSTGGVVEFAISSEGFLPEDENIDRWVNFGFLSVVVGEGIHSSDVLTSEEHSPWGKAAEVHDASRVNGGTFILQGRSTWVGLGLAWPVCGEGGGNE